MLVGTNTRGLQSFGRELLTFVRHQVATEGTSSTFASLRPRSKMRTWHRRHLGRSEMGPACCYNTGNTGWGGAQGDTRTFSGVPKGKKDVRLFKRVSCFLFFPSSAEFPNRVIPVDNRLFPPRQTVSFKGLPRSLTIPLDGHLSGRSVCWCMDEPKCVEPFLLVLDPQALPKLQH